MTAARPSQVPDFFMTYGAGRDFSPNIPDLSRILRK
jgi:hypothetical protein